MGTEPGSGGCLDALNRRETRRARIAPTPSPPVEERPKSRGGSLRMCLGQDSGVPPLKLPCLDSLLGALIRRDTRRTRIRKPSGNKGVRESLHKGWFVGSLTRFSSLREATPTRRYANALASQWESICGFEFFWWRFRNGARSH